MIPYKRHTLSNGLTVAVNRDRQSKLAAVNILYKVGARNEDPARTGFAHLFEHLMFRGTRDVPDFDLPVQMACGDNNAFTNAVIEKVMANATVEIPDAMVERQIDSMVRNFEARLAQQGLKLAAFMKYTGQDEKSFRNQYRDQAEKSVRANLVLEAVENVEKFEATEEEIDAEIEKFAKQIGQNVEELKKNLTEGDREYFKADVIRDKAVKFLCDNAKAE